MPRPDFFKIKTFEEFSKYYWYREELQKICRQHGIYAGGMKAELYHNIEEYFKGNIIRPEKKRPCRKRSGVSPKSPVSTPLTLQTSLLECNFRFSQRFRKFFSEQTDIYNFKFNTAMVATAKKVRETNDTTVTLGDLLDIYYGRKTYATYDKSCLQWNKFLQDFCADPATVQFPNKLKTAARLWKIVRESTREKIYRHELLEEFAEQI